MAGEDLSRRRRHFESLYLSRNTRLCSEHFTPDFYEGDFQAELLGSKKRTSLKADAVPSIFSHRPAQNKPRLSSDNRALQKARQEVTDVK